MNNRKSEKPSAFGNQTRLLDLSRELGVSLTTISRALRGKAGMSEETRERIKEAAKRHGYISNKAGATLSTGRIFSVGYIIPKDERGTQLQADVMHGMLKVLTQHGYSLTVYSEDYFKLDKGDSLLDAARALRVDALVMTIEHDLPLIVPKSPLPFPLVVVNRRIEGLEASFVLADEERGGELAIKHLIGLGHRKIAYIGGPKNHAALVRRENGYARALSAAGLELDQKLIAHASDISWRGGHIACGKLFTRPGFEASAIFCGSDILAFGAIRHLHERAISIPADIALVSFDDSMFADMTEPTLTSVRKQRQAMGQEAARIVMGRLSGVVVPSETMLPVELIVRGSSEGRVCEAN